MRLFLLILFIAISYKCAPCTCDDPLAFNAVSVFEGEVLKVNKVDTPYACYIITIKVGKYVKGIHYNTDTLYVQTPCLSDACCGIPFAVKDKYIIYASLKDSMLYTDVCNGTRKIAIH